jgi:predicted deacylase
MNWLEETELSMADLNDMATPDDSPLESTTFAGLQPGPRLLVLGAVHGNETCGPNAIRRAIEDCRAGRLRIRRGSVTFVPVANPKAYRQRTREGDRNLNRDLHDKPVPRDHEDRIGNRLCALLRTHDVLLDIHSFSGEGEPFVFFGPENNSGPVEPFRSAAAEADFAARLGVSTIIYGWLENYAHLIAARDRLALPPLSAMEGYGTTEYMRFSGGYGATIECGSHDDPASAEIASRAIVNAFATLSLIDAERPHPQVKSVIHMNEVVICEAEGDRLEGDWKTGDAVAAGSPIARRANGEIVTARTSGFIIFPNRKAKAGEGICHFGVASDRLRRE